jgi:DNA-binding beta-propeller fold protein YncE
MMMQSGSTSRGVLIGLAVVAGIALVASAYLYLDRLTQRGSRTLERSFRLDDSPLRRVDPGLITYRQVEQVPTGLAVSAGIAVDGEGRLVVAGDRQVRVLDEQGQAIRSIELADRPTCIAAGADGMLWVGFVGRIEAYAAAGADPAVRLDMPAGAYVTSLAPDGEDVWVADAGRKLVLCVDRQGKIKLELRGSEGLLVPSPHLDVAVHDGLVWVANPGRWRLEAYTREGGPVRSFGRMALDTAGFVGCCNPSDFAILPDGGIITSEKGAARVKVFNTGAGLEGVVADATTLGDIEGAMDVAVDAAGRVYVLDTRSRSVRIFQRKDEP